MKKNKPTEIDIKAAMVNNTQREAAEILGVSYRTLKRRLHEMRSRGYAPEHDWTETVPEGFFVKGESELVRTSSGGIKWIKSERDKEFFARVLDTIKESFLSELPRAKPTPPIPIKSNDLLNLFVLSDFHLGALAWSEETGADWDLGIAQETLIRWMTTAIQCAPKADTAVFCNLGDFLHIDGIIPVTPTSGHVLDVDTRYQKLIRTVIEVMRQCIALLLDNYQHVHIINAEGNHDQSTSMWLRESIPVWYELEPRVTVETSPDPYYAYEWGRNSIFFHHGHKVPAARVEQTFIAKFRDMYGRTQYSYGHLGHLHHRMTKESSLMEITQWSTIAAPDAYASRGGWLSKRSSGVVTYHKNHGRVSEQTISLSMIGME